mgnify:FL=1
MEKISFLCDKEITDILKMTIEKTHNKCVLRIIKNEEHAEYKDMSNITVEYADPWLLIGLEEDIAISRLVKRGIL